MTMRRKIGILLVVVSVALNIAFIAVWATHAIPRHLCRHGRDGQREGVSCPLHRNVGVTEAQWHELEPHLQEFRQASRTACAEVNEDRAALIDLIAAPRIDRAAIKAKQDEILEGQRKMQSLVIDHLLREKETLDATQQETLFRMLRRRSGCAGHGPMMGMGISGNPVVREQCRGHMDKESRPAEKSE
jgi:Spy/CpxP family protein refolding chaperone